MLYWRPSPDLKKQKVYLGGARQTSDLARLTAHKIGVKTHAQFDSTAPHRTFKNTNTPRHLGYWYTLSSRGGDSEMLNKIYQRKLIEEKRHVRRNTHNPSTRWTERMKSDVRAPHWQRGPNQKGQRMTKRQRTTSQPRTQQFEKQK